MNASPLEILSPDSAAAEQLLALLLRQASEPQAVVLGRVAEAFARHRATFTPGPLARKLEDAYTHLLVAGCHDDELLARLKVARDSARNLGKERAA